MSDLAILIIAGYVVLSFAVGVLVGKMIKWGREGDG